MCQEIKIPGGEDGLSTSNEHLDNCMREEHLGIQDVVVVDIIGFHELLCRFPPQLLKPNPVLLLKAICLLPSATLHLSGSAKGCEFHPSGHHGFQDGLFNRELGLG